MKGKIGTSNMNFGNNLKNLRKRKNVTQKQLATYLCLSRSTIAGYETKSHQPDFLTLEKLAIYFDVSIDYLITGK
jgi:transcriptional regulator with XRE-family HTH domain